LTTPSPASLKASVETSVGFVEYVADVLRGSNWVRKLLLIDVLLFVTFNPVTFSRILDFFTNQPLPKQYSLCFWIVIALPFATAICVAARNLHKPATILRSLVDQSPIKGLLPFNFDDAKFFTRMQREADLRECLQAVTDNHFRIGVLCGKSGCGKSSLLQAGLWPRLLVKQHQCVYVQVTNLDPLISIRQAFVKQLGLPVNTVESADFKALANAVTALDPKSIVLILDQFEQFFVHNPKERDREHLVQALAAWYRETPPSPLKVLISLRADFYDRLIELQKALGYSLGPHEVFRLEEFTPDEAVAIFRVIADAEGLVFDADFVDEFVKRDLTNRDDGLVSPVDIQILAWIIVGQKTEAERAFNRKTYQKLGGTEGLLERFLQRALETRETEPRRQAAIKILLALTDLDRNTRAGMLTVNDLKKKLGETVSVVDVKEAVDWLARSDVRLISMAERNESKGYELAHERLVPALRRIAGKELTRADQANQLLERRVNEWLGNNRSARYLLTWREWRLVERERPYINWGAQKEPKEALVARTKRHWQIRIALLLLPLAIGVSLFGWWMSPWGQIYQARRQLLTLSDGIKDDDTLSRAAEAFAFTGDLPQAMQL